MEEGDADGLSETCTVAMERKLLEALRIEDKLRVSSAGQVALETRGLTGIRADRALKEADRTWLYV